MLVDGVPQGGSVVRPAEGSTRKFSELDPAERLDKVAVRKRAGLRRAAVALIEKGRKKRRAALQQIDNARISKLS
jgi:hypothetical protein